MRAERHHDPDSDLDGYTVERLEPVKPKPKAKAPRRRLGAHTAAELLDMELPPISYIVPDYICEGLTLLAGKSKIGKSWLLASTAVAVATGGLAFGTIPVEEGDVLLLALEDNRRRMKKRLVQLLPNGNRPHRLTIDYVCPRMDDGGLEDIRAWIESVPKPRLIVIDVLNRVRPAMKPGEMIYDYDVRSLEGLQRLAAEFGIAIVVAHHTNKGIHEDPFDCLSGSTGLPGTADTTFVLARDSQGTTLYGRGRDVEEIETAMSFDRTTGMWTALGGAKEVRRSDERTAVLVTLKNASVTMTPAAIAEATGGKRENVKKLLGDMARAGEVVSLGPRKGYVHPDRTDLLDPGYHGYRGYQAARDGEDEGDE